MSSNAVLIKIAQLMLPNPKIKVKLSPVICKENKDANIEK